MFSFGLQRVILPRQESAAVVRTLIVAIAVPVVVLAKGIYIIVALIIVLICKGIRIVCYTIFYSMHFETKCDKKNSM